jgi:hypothetical protein
MKKIEAAAQAEGTWAVIIDGVVVQSCLFTREVAEEVAAAIHARQFEPEIDSQYGVLTRASYTIEGHVLRSEVQRLLDDAADNAYVTMQDAWTTVERSWEEVFRSTLSGLLSDSCDAVVRDWFRAQGVAW